MAVKKEVVSTDVPVPQPADIGGEFDAVYVPEAQEIEVVAGASNAVKGKGGLDPYAQELAFNEEFIEVMLHESTDPNAENPVYTACNGVSQYFFRGQVQQVRRKFVGILASAKEHRVSTPEYRAADGSQAMGIRRTSSLKYPFSVVSDKNPRGAAWLKSLLSAPT
jgi:hypothetical protein